METILFQKIEHLRTGKEFDLSFLTVAKMVETLDLSGPRLMLTFRDPNRYISDVLGIAELDEIKVTLADAYTTDEMSETMTFTILTRPKISSTIEIEALHSSVYKIKTPIVRAKMFVRRGASSILGNFFPDLKLDTGKFPVVEDYHLLPGDRSSGLLRQYATEQGGSMFVRRGSVCFKRKEELYKAEPTFTYENNNPKAKYAVIQHVEPSSKALREDRAVRNVSGWNETKGWLKSAINSAAPALSHSTQSLATINNTLAGFMPAIDFTCSGNGKLSAGQVIKFIWHTHITERPLDESLPEKILVEEVLHYYTSQKYFCRVKGVKPIEKYK